MRARRSECDESILKQIKTKKKNGRTFFRINAKLNYCATIDAKQLLVVDLIIIRFHLERQNNFYLEVEFWSRHLEDTNSRPRY